MLKNFEKFLVNISAEIPRATFIIEPSLKIEFNDFKQLNDIKELLYKLDKGLSFIFFENNGIS